MTTNRRDRPSTSIGEYALEGAALGAWAAHRLFQEAPEGLTPTNTLRAKLAYCAHSLLNTARYLDEDTLQRSLKPVLRDLQTEIIKKEQRQ